MGLGLDNRVGFVLSISLCKKYKKTSVYCAIFVKSSQRMLKQHLQILEPRYSVDKLFKTSVALSHEHEWEGMQENHYFDDDI